ncbi:MULTISPECIES: DUF6868 family protein [Psychrilyobacter]|uniref:DUF6868 domain-containing protein n=1 Tax=Psychrilyobacter piezotolerans TaxID=2293438 RepID=A0ABX9KHB4_9FUSO|nr:MULTISPECIES: hypothetical protein [Psychrilyobacter]MCS5420652.1 hypothetical protein [Psychrilyobacter sp. S5]NDI77826.1 hypothetical protein [Psychrilyobacter piezotolerans]RDE62320.1 hypothetical protein DV867_07045 [Psychrilyobacter sp. S5]REI41418.1 hypothetical protein DYH56_07045 [Psychrilyobacter piezotolerans]
MNKIEVIREFLGWCSVINIGLGLFSMIFITSLRGPVLRIHSKIFNLDENDLSRGYFQLLGQYKIAIIMLNIVPYLVLRIMY